MGSDSNKGTSTGKPWQTVAKVNTTLFRPGDSILFQRGGLWRETLIPASSGSVNNQIIFGAYGAGTAPTINASDTISEFSDDSRPNVWNAPLPNRPNAVWVDGNPLGQPAMDQEALTEQNQWFWDSGIFYIYSIGDPGYHHTVEVAERNYAIFLNQKNYLTLSDLNATNANDRSLYLRNANNITVQNVSAHDSVNQAVMIGIGGGNDLISGSELYNSGLGGTFGTGSALHIQNTTRPSIIQHTYIHDFGIAGGNHAVYDEGGGDLYRYNHFTSSAKAVGMAINVDVPNTEFIYNVFNAIPAGGIYLTTASNTKIYNNTFYNVGTRSPYAVIWFAGSDSEANLDIKNNIAYVPHGYSVGFLVSRSATGWNSDYNDILVNFFGSWGTRAELAFFDWQSATGEDGHSTDADPLFTNAEGGDFTLGPGSPAIGSGVYIPNVSTSKLPNKGAQ